MTKVDLRKELKHLYAPSAKAVVEVQVPAFTFLMIDGQGDPNHSTAYAEAVEALFTVSYTAKFMLKKAPKGRDYAVMPPEGLWWAEDMATFTALDKDSWKWTLMIAQPAEVSADMFQQAVAQSAKKKDLPALAGMRLERFAEGLAAQIMHVGPFAAEAATIERLHRFIEQHGYRRRDKHHEIYLSDLRRTAPEKLKTVIRQPVEPAGSR